MNRKKLSGASGTRTHDNAFKAHSLNHLGIALYFKLPHIFISCLTFIYEATFVTSILNTISLYFSFVKCMYFCLIYLT